MRRNVSNNLPSAPDMSWRWGMRTPTGSSGEKWHLIRKWPGAVSPVQTHWPYTDHQSDEWRYEGMILILTFKSIYYFQSSLIHIVSYDINMKLTWSFVILGREREEVMLMIILSRQIVMLHPNDIAPLSVSGFLSEVGRRNHITTKISLFKVKNILSTTYNILK